MFLLRLLIAAFIVSYVIWFFNTRILGKSLSLYKVTSWVMVQFYLRISDSYLKGLMC